MPTLGDTIHFVVNINVPLGPVLCSISKKKRGENVRDRRDDENLNGGSREEGAGIDI